MGWNWLRVAAESVSHYLWIGDENFGQESESRQKRALAFNQPSWLLVPIPLTAQPNGLPLLDSRR